VVLCGPFAGFGKRRATAVAMRRFRTHYDNLKVSRDAPAEVIRSAYKALANKYHPDRNHGSERALRAMQAINTSFEVLNDPVKRKAHDEWIDRKTGHSASAPNTATRPAPQQEPFRPSPPPQQEPTHTYTPPPNPTLEWQLGCFRWIMGFILVGIVFGVLDMCSDKPRRSRYSPPAPAATPTPTALPSPAKPVDPIKAPFGMQWGETVERVQAFVQRAGARVVSDGVQDYQRVMVVDGIEGRGLDHAIFRFLNNSLREVSIHYGAAASNGSASDLLKRWVVDANDKYGEGYRFRNIDTEVEPPFDAKIAKAFAYDRTPKPGIRKKVQGWAWIQDNASFQMLLSSRQADGRQTGNIILTYTSTEFPPHETVAFLTDQPGRAPLKVQTEAGSNFLLKLVDPQTRKDVMRMFIVGGQEANFWIPVGEYELVYASGQHWYGDELLFGPETEYAKADALTRFAPAASSADAAKIPDLERRQTAAVKALRDYMVRNKFANRTIDFIFEGRDPQENLKGPERLTTEWWQQNVLDKIGNKPGLYNGLVDRLNAFNRAANALLKLHSDAGGYKGVSLTLYAVRGGNLETVPISAEDFAGAGGEATP
jgi:hypothetical protein